MQDAHAGMNLLCWQESRALQFDERPTVIYYFVQGHFTHWLLLHTATGIPSFVYLLFPIYLGEDCSRNGRCLGATQGNRLFVWLGKAYEFVTFVPVNNVIVLIFFLNHVSTIAW